MVCQAGIEPATYSLEDRSSYPTAKKFNAFGVQNTADDDQSPPLHAPPAHHDFCPVDLQPV